MLVARSGVTSLLGKPPLKNPRKTLSALAGIALTLALLASSLLSDEAASAAPSPKQETTTPFLTLPFIPDSNINILGGWYYSGSGGYHGGIDYIHGSVGNPRTWTTFGVVAAADGEACGNCSSRQGNAVWVKHNVNGVTYYSYYGHLATISQHIPIGSQSKTVKVKRGELLGMAGDTGSRGSLHLHFALYTSGSKALDPYNIYGLRELYPAPKAGSPGIGWFLADTPAQKPAEPVAAPVDEAQAPQTQAPEAPEEDAPGSMPTGYVEYIAPRRN